MTTELEHLRTLAALAREMLSSVEPPQPIAPAAAAWCKAHDALPALVALQAAFDANPTAVAPNVLRVSEYDGSGHLHVRVANGNRHFDVTDDDGRPRGGFTLDFFEGRFQIIAYNAGADEPAGYVGFDEAGQVVNVTREP